MHRVDIDVSKVKLTKPLQSGTRTVRFEFIDPVWAWVCTAASQEPGDLHWKPAAQHQQNPVYGGGVQYGKSFLEACNSCPPGTYPMCVALHWDGTSGHGIHADPICIGVGNTNSCSADTQCCIGYMPSVPDDGRPGFAEHKDSTTMKFHIRQECCRAILRVLEQGAVRGVRCRLPNIHYTPVSRVLFPRLIAMNFDQPEAQLFFGMKNKTSCSKCRRRKGFSAFRRATPLSGCQVRRLYDMVKEGGPVSKTYSEKLQRWGFNPTRECCLHSVLDVNKLLVRVPSMMDEVFPSIDYRDRMHGVFIFLHRVLVETMNTIPELTKGKKAVFDQRLQKLCVNRYFRDNNGKLFRKQKSIFDSTGMTAADKIAMVFLMPHVLNNGFGAGLIPQQYRAPLLTVIAHTQLVFIAVSGNRQYTKPELHAIFDRGYLVIFGGLEAIRAEVYNSKFAQHAADPESCPPPKRMKLQTRCVLTLRLISVLTLRLIKNRP